MKKENKILEDQKMNKSKVSELKKYTQPELRKMGSMQKVTLGGSQAIGDSGTNGLVNP